MQTQTIHRHRPNGDPREVTSFTGEINGAPRPNPKAHGNIAIVERCRCGATRVTNANYYEREYGPWVE